MRAGDYAAGTPDATAKCRGAVLGAGKKSGHNFFQATLKSEFDDAASFSIPNGF